MNAECRSSGNYNCDNKKGKGGVHGDEMRISVPMLLLMDGVVVAGAPRLLGINFFSFPLLQSE